MARAIEEGKSGGQEFDEASQEGDYSEEPNATPQASEENAPA